MSLPAPPQLTAGDPRERGQLTDNRLFLVNGGCVGGRSRALVSALTKARNGALTDGINGLNALPPKDSGQTEEHGGDDRGSLDALNDGKPPESNRSLLSLGLCEHVVQCEES